MTEQDSSPNNGSIEIDPRYLLDEVTQDLSEIGNPELSFTFYTIQNLPSREAKVYESAMREISRRDSEDDTLELSAHHVASLVKEWNFTDKHGQVIEVPTLDDSVATRIEKIGQVRRRHIEYVIFTLLQFANNDPLINLVQRSMINS